MDRTRARLAARTGAPHRAHRRQRRVDGGGRTARASRLLLDGRARRRHAGLDPEDVRRDPRDDVRRRRPVAVPRRTGHPRPGALPQRRRLRERLLPASRRSRAGHAVRARVQRLPPRLVQRRSRPAARGDRTAVLGRRPRHHRAPPRHRARSPGGELLQPAPGLRPASARAPSLGSGVGRGPGGRHLGELPRRRRLDGHAVRRRRRDGVDDELRQGVVVHLPRQPAQHRRPHLRRRVPPLPRAPAGVGGVGGGLDPCGIGDLRLAVAQRRRARRAPGVRPVAERVLPASDLRLLLVRAAGRAGCHRAVPREHPVRERLPAPDVPAPRSPHARSTAARLRAGRARVAARRRRAEGAARQRRVGLPLS